MKTLKDQMILCCCEYSFEICFNLIFNSQSYRADYVTWNGANPEIVASRKSLAVGTDSTNRLPKKSTAKGSNSANCKGSNKKLIKGSMYSNIRCN